MRKFEGEMGECVAGEEDVRLCIGGRVPRTRGFVGMLEGDDCREGDWIAAASGLTAGVRDEGMAVRGG